MAWAGLLGALASRPLVTGAVLLALGIWVAPHAAWLTPLASLVLWPRLGPLSLFFALGVGLATVRAEPRLVLDQGSLRSGEAIVLDGVIALAPELEPEAEVITLDLIAIMPRPPGPLEAARGRVRVWLPRPRGTVAACGWAGDRVRVLATLSPIPPARHPGEAAAGQSLARRGISGFARASAPRHCSKVHPAPSPSLAVRMERARSRVHESIEGWRSDAVGAVVRAFATGDRSGIPRPVEEDFAASGLSHLLAVSGLNLAIVAGLVVIFFAAILRRVRFISLGLGVSRTTAFIALPLLLFYAYFVGLSASAVRAALMMGAVLIATCLRRRVDAASTLALAVIVMSCLDPLTLYDPSFQLSFAAVVALLDLYPRLRHRLTPNLRARPWLWRAAIEIALVSFAATIGTAPIVAFHFQRLSVIGTWVNVPAAPLGSFVLVPLSLLGAAVSAVWAPWAVPVLDVAAYAAALLVSLAEGAADLPLATITLPPPSLPELVFAYALIYLRPPRGRRWVRAAGVLLVAASWSAPLWSRSFQTDLRVSFLPVGQGDAAVLELPGGAVWLVDVGPPGHGGPSSAERVIVPELRSRGIRAIDTVVLTHPHADHVGGLAAILAAFPVQRILWNGDRRESSTALIEPVLGGPHHVVEAGSGPWRYGGARIEILSPSAATAELASVNERSLVLSVKIGERHVLLTGDAEAEAERALVERHGAALRADVLKAGHHGSRSSSTPSFLGAVRPKHVLLSLGAQNRFGFPHPEVLERIEQAGAEVWRTDQHGLVRLRTDGQTLEIWPFAPPSRPPGPLGSGARSD